MFEPKHLRRWTKPDHYAGEVWPAYYSAGVGQSRDSDALERSNFTCMLEALGGESETVTVVFLVYLRQSMTFSLDGFPALDYIVFIN